MNDASRTHQETSTWLPWLVLTFLAVAVVGAICVWVIRQEAVDIEGVLREREAARTGVLAQVLRSDLQPAINDVQTLADGDGLRAFLESAGPVDLEQAVRRAVFVSGLNDDYDQIRYLDESGREVLRVDRGGRIAPADRLQDKSDRPYFQRASVLDAGQVYVSNFDLNVENDRVEEPFKPMLRFATPVFDAAGHRRGIYVINYLGGNLLTRLAASVPETAHRMRVLNAEGYWLRAGTPDEEWGFQLPGRADATLARSEADLWTHVARDPQGQARRAGGLFTWIRVTPGEFTRDGRVVGDDAYLVIASAVSPPEFAALFTDLRRAFLVITPTLLALVIGAAWVLRARQRFLVSLRRSEESLSVTLHSIGDAVLATDTDGRISRMNRVAEALTGWSQAEASGRPIADVFRIINEETREAAIIPVEEVLATGEIHGLANHTVLIARDGSERAIADSAAPIRDRGGRILGVVLVFRDTTAERRAEAALRTSAAEIHDLYNLAPCGYHSLDADGLFIAINDTELHWLGYTRDEIVGRRRFPDLLTDASQATFRESFPRFKAQGWIHDLEFDLKRKDGSTLPVLLNATAVRDAQGRHVSSRSTMFDNSRRKQAEEERDRFFALSLDLLCISSADGYFKRVSPAVADMLGWTVDEFLARPFIEFVHPDDRGSTQREVERQMVAGERVLHFENRYRHKDGSWRVLSWRSAPYRDLMYATARDVTDRKRHEDRIQRLNHDLEQHAVQLEAANQELESFSYSVSHDLRAPLRHVQGYVDMLTRELRGQQLSEKAERYLATIAGASVRMGQLIDDLLAFSKMSRVEMREAPVHLDSLIEEVVRGLEMATRGRSIAWTVGALPIVMGDRSMLKQVLANLLGNAVKYSRGRRQARIEVGCAGDEDGRTVVFVRDNGAGFDMAYAHKLFGVFQRLHAAEEFEGTGIGLANVRRIISRHGGRTWAEGRVDEGAVFYFTLQPMAGPA